MEHNLLLMGGGNNWSSTSWGSWQTASYTGTVDNTGGGAFSGSGNSVTAGANSSTSSRKGNLKLSQPRSGIQENGNSWPSPSNINVRLSQSKIKEIISFTLYSGNAANNGIIIDGGRYKINETCELDISNDNEIYLYVTPSGNSTNYVTINTKNIERLSQKKKIKRRILFSFSFYYLSIISLFGESTYFSKLYSILTKIFHNTSSFFLDKTIYWIFHKLRN